MTILDPELASREDKAKEAAVKLLENTIKDSVNSIRAMELVLTYTREHYKHEKERIAWLENAINLLARRVSLPKTKQQEILNTIIENVRWARG